MGNDSDITDRADKSHQILQWLPVLFSSGELPSATAAGVVGEKTGGGTEKGVKHSAAFCSSLLLVSTSGGGLSHL